MTGQISARGGTPQLMLRLSMPAFADAILRQYKERPQNAHGPIRGFRRGIEMGIEQNKPGLPPQGPADRRYIRTLTGDLAHTALGALPSHWREAAAERWFRRSGAPGPANEHVFQYLISKQARGDATKERSELAVLRGADLFYERQYRQYLNATMGAFAMTATLALLGSGGKCRGRLWGRHRLPHTAMVEEAGGASPVIVLDRQSVAVPLLLPAPHGVDTVADIERWLSGRRAMPRSYRSRIAGEKVPCATPKARATRRGAAAALIELADAVQHTGKLAILALHPHDPDAMGLHITLFGTQVLSPEALEADYGLEKDFLSSWRQAASAQNAVLHFFVGGTEELFTHCSLNLFIKRRVSCPGGAPEAWHPSDPLEKLLTKQFEIFQATVSASGLPGISPRNCDAGKAGFVVRKGSKTSILMPYFTGNFIHGHAAKLWSNPQGALMIRDDHTSLSLIVIRGKAYTVGQDWVRRHFPDVAGCIATRRKQSGEPAADPEYWFVQEVSEILQQDEPLAANALDPARPACTIHSAGPALYDKKPGYFATANTPCYNQASQHAREAAGRPADPSGASHRQWQQEVMPALAVRGAHLERACVTDRAREEASQKMADTGPA